MVILLVAISISAILFLTFELVNYVAQRKINQPELSAALSRDIRFQDVGGIKLAYRVFGDAPSVLLLIHGFWGTSYDFTPLIPGLSREHTVVAVDLIGFGFSAKDAGIDYSKKQMAALCMQLMAELAYNEYAVAGHSMGGEIALHLAYSYPQKVTRLILLDSSGVYDLQKGFRRPVSAWIIRRVLQNYLVGRIFLPLIFAKRNHKVLEYYRNNYYLSRKITATGLNKLICDNDSGTLADSFNQIEVPALLIWGKLDQIIPLKQGRIMSQLLPHNRLLVIEQAGHLPFVEATTEVLAAVCIFLAED